MGRPSKPLERKRLSGRSADRDSGGRKLPDPSNVTQLPGAASAPPVPAELVTDADAESCWLYRGRARVDNDPNPCEACLANPGVESWNRLWEAAKSWLSVKTDIDLVVRLCKARIDEAHLRLSLKEDGPYVAGQRGGLVAHPGYGQLRVLNAEIVKLESLCGFTPSDRGRLGVGEVAPGANPLAEILARRIAERRATPVPSRAAPRRRAVGSDED